MAGYHYRYVCLTGMSVCVSVIVLFTLSIGVSIASVLTIIRLHFTTVLTEWYFFPFYYDEKKIELLTSKYHVPTDPVMSMM